MKLVVVVLLALCLCCSGSKEDDDEDSGRTVNPKYESLVKGFGDAIAQKDYRSAYDVTSPNLRKELSYDKFVETWTPYIDSLEGEIETEYTTSDDPQTWLSLCLRQIGRISSKR